jgi:hypothetical protein
MMITIDDSIAIYSRACRAWWRHNAAAQAARKAEACRTNGDQEGVEVWQQVKAEVERLDRAKVPFFQGR